MDELRVLQCRRHPLRQWREKEWWFSYCFDKTRQIYLSWSFLRAYYSDHFGLMFVDLKTRKRWAFSRLMFLDGLREGVPIALSKAQSQFEVSFGLTGANRSFRVSENRFNVDLSIGPSAAPAFVRRENQFTNQYRLVHTVQHPVVGNVAVDGAHYDLHTKWSYFDHCSGLVPRLTSWHWLAVQRDEASLIVLVNYGERSQRYAQILRNGRWVRLDQNATFECQDARNAESWRVTSTDLDITVDVLESNAAVTKVPRAFPLIVNLRHVEFVVRVDGIVRLNGRWEDLHRHYGVMEEHHGIW